MGTYRLGENGVYGLEFEDAKKILDESDEIRMKVEWTIENGELEYCWEQAQELWKYGFDFDTYTHGPVHFNCRRYADEGSFYPMDLFERYPYGWSTKQMDLLHECEEIRVKCESEEDETRYWDLRDEFTTAIERFGDECAEVFTRAARFAWDPDDEWIIEEFLANWEYFLDRFGDIHDEEREILDDGELVSYQVERFVTI